ncbi:MAG: tRNA pseudouridine(38-40) synthase TruA [Pseudomonadota bacterium]
MTKRRGPPPGTTRTIRLDVQYEGTAYAGFQCQANGESVQALLQRALVRVASEKVTLFASSRTDAGVHARQQVVSFSLGGSRTPVRAFVEGTNALLPEDIRVVEAAEVDLWFHANQDAIEKTYRYFFYSGRVPSVFLRRFALHLRKEPDWQAAEEAAKLLVGKHDFAAFRTRGTLTKSSVRTVLSTRFKEDSYGLRFFEIRADGFLKHMVRNIVGTLLEIGHGKREVGSISAILRSKDRRFAGATAPPHGLFLWRVVY